jgi:hypothetical protein
VTSRDVFNIVRLAVGLGQWYTGDVCTFLVVEDTGHLSSRHYSPFKVNFILHLLKYLLISSILLCSVLYSSEMSSAHVQRAAILYCVDICIWIKGSEFAFLGFMLKLVPVCVSF